MTKYQRRPLKKIMHSQIFSEINPRFENGWPIIPCFGKRDSQYQLVVEMDSWIGSPKKESMKDALKRFQELDKKYKRFLAYTLSHQLKIATLAASIALSSQESNVYEIGSGWGAGSFLYSRCIKANKVSQSKPIYNLTAIEKDENFIRAARHIKQSMNKEFITEVKFVNKDANYFLRKCRSGDIIFASLAQPNACNSILRSSNSRKINFTISYGENFDYENFEKSIDSNIYHIFPFKDGEYNRYVPEQPQRFGVIVVTVKVQKKLKDELNLR